MIIRIRRSAGLALLGWAVAGQPSHALDLQRFPYSKTLAAEPPGSHTIGRFEFDEELFAGCDAACSGLRVMDGTGMEVPFLVRTVRDRREVVTEHGIPSRTIDFELLPENRFRVTVERLDEDPVRPASIMELSSAQKDYEKKVTVLGTDDRETWTTLAEDVPIFDYSRYLDLRHDRVRITPARHRTYRVEVSNITEERESPLIQIARESRDGRLVSEIEKTHLQRADFRLETIRLVEERKTWAEGQAGIRDYGVLDFAVVQDPERKATEIRFGVRNVPLREVRFDIRDRYFSRPVAVEAHAQGEGGGGWVPVASGMLQRIPGGDHASGCVVKLPRACRYARYRAAIRNMDSPPLEVAGVAVQGEVQEGVFLCEPGGDYRVVYGAEGMKAPQYDIERIVRHTGRDAMDPYILGAETANVPFSRSRLSRLGSTRALLVPAVVLMVLVLTWLIVRASRRVGTGTDSAGTG